MIPSRADPEPVSSSDASGARREDVRTRLAIAVLAGLLVVLAYQMYRSAYREHGNDLTSYLLSARALMRGESPYALQTPFPYVYPITLAWLLMPLALIPYPVAALTWFAANAAALAAACVGIVRAAFVRAAFVRAAPGRSVLVPLTVTGVLLLDVIQNNLRNGQVNLLVLAVCVWSFRSLIAGRQVAAGCGLGLAAAIKLLPLLLIGYALMRRQFRCVAAAIGAFVLLCLAPYPFLGARIVPIYREYVQSFVLRSLEASSAPAELLDFRLARVLGELLPAAPGGAWTQFVAVAVVAALLAAVDFAGLRQPRDRAWAASPREPWMFSLYLIALPLLSPISEVHHLAFVLPAAALHAVQIASGAAGAAAIVLLAVALPAYFIGQVYASGIGYFVALVALAAATTLAATTLRASADGSAT